MLTRKMNAVLNCLINVDLESAYLYMAAAVYAQSNEWEGIAKWLNEQTKEEQEHARKLIDYMLDRGGMIQWRELEAPPSCFGSPLDLWNQILQHEQHVTATYKRALEEAMCEGDYQTVGFLQTFVQEQIDEEAQAERIIRKLSMAGNNTAAFLLVDQEIGKRAG